MYYLEGIKNDNFKYGEIANDILVEKKSKFLSYVFNISTEQEAKSCIDKISSAYKDARHIVYIYTFIENGIKMTKFSDDGEPTGTGTKSINELLNKEEITNTCIVIVRYFGGVLLGTGLLTRSYLNVARNAINNCNKKILYNFINKDYILEYPQYDIFKSKIKEYILDEKIVILKEDFLDKVYLKMKVEESLVQKIEGLVR